MFREQEIRLLSAEDAQRRSVQTTDGRGEGPTVETLERIIQQHQFFQGIGMEERHIELITGCAKNVRFEQGQVILNEGDEANEFYFIREGLVAVD